MPKRLDPAVREKIAARLAGGAVMPSVSALARETGIDRATARRLMSEAGRVVPPPDVPAVPPSTETARCTKTDDAVLIEFVDDEFVENEDQVWARSGLDRLVWYVVKWKCNAYQSTMRLRDGVDVDGRRKPDQPRQKQLWQISAEFRRILPKPFQDAQEAIFRRMADHAPTYPAFVNKPCKDPHLLELDLFDVHIGKYAWAPESGQNYDLKIAAEIYRHAIQDLLARSSGFNIDQVLLPIGSDFYHVDNQESATTAGTRVDSDGRYAKIIETGEMAIIWAVELLMTVAPVRLIWVPGNHDRIASYHLARTVAAYFRNTKGRVEVDHSPTTRKYHRYGRSLLGFTHGHREKHASLPTLMAQERKHDWAETTHRAWRIGHKHTTRVQATMPLSIIEVDGVEIRTMKALSAHDAWHYEEGYSCGNRAAEAFIVAHDCGFMANLQVPVRESATPRRKRA